MIANHKSQYHSAGFGKDNIGNKILPKSVSLGDWLNGIAIHLFKEYRKKGRWRGEEYQDSILDILSWWDTCTSRRSVQ